MGYTRSSGFGVENEDVKCLMIGMHFEKLLNLRSRMPFKFPVRNKGRVCDTKLSCYIADIAATNTNFNAWKPWIHPVRSIALELDPNI